MKRERWAQVVMCALVLVLAGIAAADGPARMKVLVPADHVNYNRLAGGPIGAFCYRQSDNRFYVSTYGANLGIRAYVGPDQEFPAWVGSVIDRPDGKSWQCATESDLLRVASSVDIEGGLCDPGSGATFSPSGMTLNPAPVTVNGYTYGPGELVVINAMGKALDNASTKRIVTWDFREIWSFTDKQPDRANAEWRPGMLETDVFGPQYGLGCTNWNDAFNSLCTLQGLGDAIGVTPKLGDGDNIGGRRGVFASNGSHVYFVSMASSSNLLGGVWSVEMSTRTIKRLFDNSAGKVTNSSEPGVLPIGVRNLTGEAYDPNLDQVLFNSTDVTGNDGGLSCLVDDGNDTPKVYTAVPADKVMDLLEVTVAPKAWSIAADQDGTIYFYTNKPYVLLKYDVQGRLVAVANRAMHYAFNCAIGAANSTNTAYLRLDLRKVHVPLNADDPNDPGLDIPQLMFMSTAGKCVAGVDVYPTGDFDLDGKVTLADMNLFKTQIQRTRSGSLPVMADGQAYLDYVECDLNGNSEVSSDKSGLEAACVTDKDMQVLHQFVLPGDADLDGCVTAADEAIVQANVGAAQGMDWSKGDFNFADDVDADDLALLTANMGRCAN